MRVGLAEKFARADRDFGQVSALVGCGWNVAGMWTCGSKDIPSAAVTDGCRWLVLLPTPSCRLSEGLSGLKPAGSQAVQEIL